MTPIDASPDTHEKAGSDAAPISAAAGFLAALDAAKAALGQPVPDSREAFRTLRQNRKRSKRLLAPVRKVRLAILAPSRPAAYLKQALVPLARIRSVYRRQRWMLEVRAFVRRNWKVALLLVVLTLVWAFWRQILATAITLAQSISW